MIKIKLKMLWQLWVVCTVSIVAFYPVSVLAANVLVSSNLTAPFVFSWVGVWVFSGAGGFCAGFITVNDIDARLEHPRAAKFVIGLFWGVAICSLIDAFAEPPQGALTFFALAVSSFATPSTAGAMVWLSNQKRIDNALNQVVKKRTGIDVSNIDEDV